jgi:hypothetical protein
MMVPALRLVRADGASQQAGVKNRGGTQDFETSYLAIPPVDHDVGLYASGRINRDA